MRLIFSFLFLFSCIAGSSQHDHNRSDTLKKENKVDSLKHSGHGHSDVPPMSHAFSLNLPMSRNGSGSGWLPDSSLMYGYMVHSKKWMYMFHGNIFARYNNQDVFNKGTRGDDKFDAVNWFMAMGQRQAGKKGLLHFSVMVSLDNFFGGNGYPLLFQTGEGWNGQPLVDRQHPHDFFSELSVSYAYAFNKKTDVFVYAGYPGEPALGSVAFMHRISSVFGPDAPLSHHWNDGTHITFGVLTGGLRVGKFKFDASVFTGREPDENRYNFDSPRFDSYSGRVSYNPNPYWSFQISEGFVNSPELIRPDEDVFRTTASAVFSKPLQRDNFINATALWGLNKSHANEHAVLLEAAWIIKRLSVYWRYEWVQKSADELDLNEEEYDHNVIFMINAATLGAGFDVVRSKAGRVAIGAQGTYYSADDRLDILYGENPMSAQVFIRFYPPRMDTSGM